MPTMPMTPVLISRTMIKTRPDGVQSQCSINFGVPTVYAPLTTADRTVYYCPIQLSGLQDDHIYSLIGEDPLDALVTALCFAGVKLGSSLYASQLDWDASINFGFPVRPDFNLPPNNPGGGGG